MSFTYSVEETIPENREINITSNSNGQHTNGSAANHPEHVHEYLALPHRRVRTVSESERIASGPAFRGVISSFCRNKGHGFIQPNDGSEPIFVHISDIVGEWCPKEGDVVSFKKTLMPPKCQKHQAVHVNFVHLKEGVKHEHWDEAPPN